MEKYRADTDMVCCACGLTKTVVSFGVETGFGWEHTQLCEVCLKGALAELDRSATDSPSASAVEDYLKKKSLLNSLPLKGSSAFRALMREAIEKFETRYGSID